MFFMVAMPTPSIIKSLYDNRIDMIMYSQRGVRLYKKYMYKKITHITSKGGHNYKINKNHILMSVGYGTMFTQIKSQLGSRHKP